MKPRSVLMLADHSLLGLNKLGFAPTSTLPMVISALVIFGAAGLALLAARVAGPRLAAWWSVKAGERGSGLTKRIRTLVFCLVSSLVLLSVLNARFWAQWPSVILGLAAACSVAVLLWTVVRAIQFPRWLSIIVAVGSFAAVLSAEVKGLRSLASILGGVGFQIGSRSLTFLDIARTATALLVLVAVVRLARRVIAHSINTTHRLDRTQKVLASKLGGVALVGAAFFVGIDVLGIDLTALAVFSGAIGLAIGFGLQKTFGNLIAGIILLWDRSIKPGDVISVGDSFGAINKIGIRAVSIVTRDGKEHLIPNENLMTQEVVNWSYSDTHVRVHIPVGVAYDCDLGLAQRLMIEAGKTPARVLTSPAPVVWLTEFGDSSINHEILVWISDPEAGVGNVQSEVLNVVLKLFKEHGIEIPFPQRDVHIHSTAETKSKGSSSRSTTASTRIPAR